MCVSPIKIITNSKHIYVDNNPKLINYVPCGKCFECRQERTKQLMVRAYFQNADYVVFDTLTYDNEHIKKFHNINVLCYDDYQKFMKRLRINLTRKNVDVKNNIKYIVAGEYGTRFTKRPHLHVIMFVMDKKQISPYTLSEVIFNSWQNGITDGVNCKGVEYFKNQRLFDNYQAKKNVVGYVCKYMTKTGDYQCEVERKLFYDVWVRLEEQNLKMSNYELAKHINKVIKPYCQFVRWSKGFGNEALKDEKVIEQIKDNGFLKIKTDLKETKYNVPLYYKRKLSQYKIHETNVLTNLGVEMKQKELKRQLEYNKKKISLILNDEKEIDKIAYYWTYQKDRVIGRKIRPIKYCGEILQCENSQLDRGLYENGKIEDTTAKQWIEENIVNCEEYDKIIEKVNKYMSEQSKKVAKLKEKIYHNKKKINYL